MTNNTEISQKELVLDAEATQFTLINQQESGIDHKPNVSQREDNFPDSEYLYMSGGAAASDVNNDGLVDLYITRTYAPDILYYNNGDGTFTDVTKQFGIDNTKLSNGAAFVDIDNDRDRDLYLTTVNKDRYYLYINDGDGNFSEQAKERGVALAIGEKHFGYGIAFGDYDLDGYIDIHTNEWTNEAGISSDPKIHNRLFRNLGQDGSPGSFEDVTKTSNLKLDDTFGFDSRFSDLDRDGNPDLVVAGDFGTSKLFWNNGDRTFTEGTTEAQVGTDENGMGLTVGDYDGDGLLDIFVSSIFDPNDTCSDESCNWGNTGNRLYHNDGNRQFSDRTDLGVLDGGWGWGTSWLDFDNDGDLNLAMANGVQFPNESSEQFVNDQTRLWRNGREKCADISASVSINDTDTG